MTETSQVAKITEIATDTKWIKGTLEDIARSLKNMEMRINSTSEVAIQAKIVAESNRTEIAAIEPRVDYANNTASQAAALAENNKTEIDILKSKELVNLWDEMKLNSEFRTSLVIISKHWKSIIGVVGFSTVVAAISAVVNVITTFR